MINKYLAMGLGALIAIAPVAAMATTSPRAKIPTTRLRTSPHIPAHIEPHRLRATRPRTSASSAHHMHKKKTAPEAPKS